MSKAMVMVEFAELDNVEFQVTGFNNELFVIKKDGQEMNVKIEHDGILKEIVEAFNTLNLAQIEEGLKKE